MHRPGGGSGEMTFTSEEDHSTEEDKEEQDDEQYTTEERCQPRANNGDEDLLAVLKRFRINWTRSMSPYIGPVDATTNEEFGPMRYTESGPPRFGGIPYDAMEIFSFKLAQIEGGLEWPLHVYGLVAVRDSIDYKRNILFHRAKDNSQVLTAEDPFLALTGPSRAIALIDPPEFEVELYAIGRIPSEEKVRTLRHTNKRLSTIELKFAHLHNPLEATIEIYHSGGTSNFHGRFFARMDYMDNDEVVLLDSQESKVTILPDGRILLSRRVVPVEEGDELRLGVKASQSRVGTDSVEHVAKFRAKILGKSDGEFNVGFCKMSVSVAWSVLV
ncbi:unnamed protein product [Urochloa decumbens]|uniref:DUF6598 domain-containing protein n=1 Tax=Urochloa decumbens TaxID=240449 RepID=A0ABC8Z4U0_9POAL